LSYVPSTATFALRFARRNRCNRFFFSQQDAPNFCTGMVQATASILGKTETAPNSSTGSGQPKGIGKRSVPETSPCHAQAKQIGELDPRKVTRDCRKHSRGIETSTELVIGSRKRIGSVRERLCTWAASAGSCERKPAVTDAAANPIV
jgi:hypothetical protein